MEGRAGVVANVTVTVALGYARFELNCTRRICLQQWQHWQQHRLPLGIHCHLPLDAHNDSINSRGLQPPPAAPAPAPALAPTPSGAGIRMQIIKLSSECVRLCKRSGERKFIMWPNWLSLLLLHPGRLTEIDTVALRPTSD